MAEEHLYSQRDVEEILRLAGSSDDASKVTRNQLLQLAGEVGLSPEQVAAAERKFAEERSIDAVRKRDEQAREHFRRQLRGEAIRHTVGLLPTFIFFLIVAHSPGAIALALVFLTLFSMKHWIPLILRDSFEARYQTWKDERSGFSQYRREHKNLL